MRVMLIFGTRPEAIKLAPVITALSNDPGFETIVVVTAQHRDLLDGVLWYQTRCRFNMRLTISYQRSRCHRARSGLLGESRNWCRSRIQDNAGAYISSRTQMEQI